VAPPTRTTFGDRKADTGRMLWLPRKDDCCPHAARLGYARAVRTRAHRGCVVSDWVRQLVPMRAAPAPYLAGAWLGGALLARQARASQGTARPSARALFRLPREPAWALAPTRPTRNPSPPWCSGTCCGGRPFASTLFASTPRVPTPYQLAEALLGRRAGRTGRASTQQLQLTNLTRTSGAPYETLVFTCVPVATYPLVSSYRVEHVCRLDRF
jgi:hypothetical protein